MTATQEPNLSTSLDREGESLSSLRKRYEKVEGIHILRLSGNDYDLGFQHGRILRETIQRGSLPFFAGFLDKLLSGALPGVLGRLASRGIMTVATRRIGQRYPQSVRDEMRGLAEGAGLSEELMLRAFTMPETYLWFISLYARLLGRPPAPRLGVPLLGCSTVAVWGDASVDGKFLHGRNLDYQGVGVWDRDQAVLFYAPRGFQRYVSVTSAGIPLGGATAMNESGLTLALHQHLSTRGVNLSGLGVCVIGDRIMREATTLEEARRLLDSHRPNAAFTYVIGSARERAMLCYEVTPRRRSWFRADGNRFGYTNIFLDPRLARDEMHFYPSQWRWNTGRYLLIQRCLNEREAPMDADAVASVLGHRGDSRCRLRCSTGMILTVGSVVFEPESGVVYVGAGRAPTSNRPYIAFDLKTESFRPDREPLTGGVPANLDEMEALDAYRGAFELYMAGADLSRVRSLLEVACARQPQESLYHFATGLIDLRAGEWVSAGKRFERALDLGHPDPERVAGFHLWRGRILDLQGKRQEAMKSYRNVNGGDGPVTRAAERGLRTPWRSRPFPVDFAFADVIVP
jgi:hypothetical protein